MGSLFSKGHNVGKVSGLEAIITAFIPVFGQLYSRIFSLHGSLDKWWTFIPTFWVPLLTSGIPSFMMWRGRVDEGKGGTPYDGWLLFPIVLYFLGALISCQYDLGEMFGELMQIFALFLGLLIAFWARESGMCTESKKKPTIHAVYAHTFNNASKVVVTVAAIPIVIGILSLVPYIGTVFEMIGMVDNLPGAKALYAVIGYIFVNMFNAYDLTKYCEGSGVGSSEEDIPILGKMSYDTWQFVSAILLVLLATGLAIGRDMGLIPI